MHTEYIVLSIWRGRPGVRLGRVHPIEQALRYAVQIADALDRRTVAAWSSDPEPATSW